MKEMTKGKLSEIADFRFLHYMYSLYSVLSVGILALVTILLISSFLPRILLYPLITGCATVVIYSLVLGMISAKDAGLRPKISIQIFIKRLADIVASGTLLLAFAPLLLVVMIVIKLESRGPVFFRQKRIGLGKKEYYVIKFRTMVHGAEVKAGNFKSEDTRKWITRSGRLLRNYSIDELPQLINILKGNMSIVGPRPVLPYEADHYDNRIFSVLPGMTCLWQVERSYNLSFQEWIKLDLKYVTEWSIFLDIKIVVSTIPAVLFEQY